MRHWICLFAYRFIGQGIKVNIVRGNKQLLDSTCSTGHTSELPASSNLGNLGGSRMLSFMLMWWKSMKKLFQWQRMQKDCRSDCMASHVSWWEQPRRRGHCGVGARVGLQNNSTESLGVSPTLSSVPHQNFSGFFFFVDSWSYLKVWHFQKISSKEGSQFTKTNYYFVNLDRKDTNFESKSKKVLFVGQSPNRPFSFQIWPLFLPSLRLKMCCALILMIGKFLNFWASQAEEKPCSGIFHLLSLKKRTGRSSCSRFSPCQRIPVASTLHITIKYLFL